MHSALKLSLFASVALSVLAPAAAQTVSTAGEIVITARRISESSQDVPGSVTAISGATIEKIGADDPTGVQGAVPNLNIVQGRGSSNAMNIYIRGVGQPDALQTFDPAVGFYVDDVYYSRIRGTQLDLFDISRVEVLRGPQGTLYGKNTIGGAVKVVTRRPDQTPYYAANVSFGDHGELTGRGSVSGPLASNFAAGVALYRATRDGYVTNPLTGVEYNDRDTWAGRLAVAWDWSSRFHIDLAADYARDNTALVLGQATNTLTNILGVPIYVVPSPLPTFAFTATPTTGLPNSTKMTHWGTSANLSWDIADNFTVRSITGYRKLNNDDFIDIDATPVELGDVFVGVDQKQFSEELQAIYTLGKASVVGGVYYLEEKIASHQEAYADDFVIGFLGATSFLRTVDDRLKTTSMAGYLNLNLPLAAKLNGSVGIRFTKEKKNYFRTTSTFSNLPLLVGTFAFTGNKTWSDTSPMASLDYHPNDHFMLYARAAHGFKSGGFNGRANNPGEDQPYDPETLWSYEAGFKWDWLDGKAITNFSLFYNDYKDFQARVSRFVTSPSQPVPSFDFAVLNAGGLKTSGAELEIAFPLSRHLRVDSQIGYLNAKYKNFLDVRAAGTIDRSWQTPAFSPKWTARFGGTYEWRNPWMGNGTVAINGSARYRSEMALSVDNSNITTLVDSGVAPGGIFPGMWQPSYWLYDASIVWRDQNDHISFGLYGKNLTDEVYRTDAQEFSSVGKIRTAYYGAPRTFLVTLTARY